jgi:hypothetical protein
MFKMSIMKPSITNNYSVLDVTVSVFKNFTSPNNPREVNLTAWLTSDKYKSEVEAIRNLATKEERDQVKSRLPAITPSGLFSNRKESNLISHSGLIQIDIDFKENQHITNYAKLKEEVCKIVNVAYFGLSVSGTGFWGLIPIKYSDKHREHFRALFEVFKSMGIVIDKLPANVASLRGYSYDEAAYFNHNATPYDVLYKPKRQKVRVRSTYSNEDTIDSYISVIEQQRVDITGGYQEWFQIGCALANEYGSSGLDYFHRISQFHTNYNSSKTDRQFAACLKHNYRFGIATFYYYFKSYGLTLKPEFDVRI